MNVKYPTYPIKSVKFVSDEIQVEHMPQMSPQELTKPWRDDIGVERPDSGATKEEPKSNEGLFFHCIIGPLAGIQSQHLMKTAAKAFSQAYEQLIGHKPSKPETLTGGNGAGFIFGPSDTRNIIQTWNSCQRKDVSLGNVQTLIGVAEAKLSDVESEFIQMDAEQAGHSGLSETTKLISEARCHLVKAIECLRGKSQKEQGNGAT